MKRLVLRALLLFAFALCAGSAWADRPISLDLKDTDFDNALRIFAEAANLNIVEIDNITARITYRVKDRPWSAALQDVLQQVEAKSVRAGDLIKIYAAATMPFIDTRGYTGRPISLDLRDTDVDGALRIVEEVSKLKIRGRELVPERRKVTLRLIDVPWDQVLSVVLEMVGLRADITDEIVLHRP